MFATRVEADDPKPSFKRFLTEFGRLLIKPPAIAYFGLALTIQWWMPAAVYLLLKTYLVAPSGLWVWSAAILTGGAFAIGMIFFFGQLVMLFPLANAAGRCKRAGDLESHKVKLAAYRARARKIRLWPMFVGMLSMLLFFPPVVTIVISDGTPMLKREHGRMRYATHEERIRDALRVFERRGIFTPLDTE